MDSEHQEAAAAAAAAAESVATEEEEEEEEEEEQEQERIESGRWPQAVLPEELSREQPVLEKAYVGVLREQRSASRAIAALADWLPCPRHLKRCHGRRVYLAGLGRLPGLGPADGPEGLKRLLGRRGLQPELLEAELEVAEVPRAAPRSRAQMRAAAAHWPVHFHPEPRLEGLLSGAALRAGGPALLGQLGACARLAGRAAGPGCGGAAAVLEPPAAPGGRPRLLALAAAAESEHPLWHAAMLAVDLVARGQAGGAWAELGPGAAGGPKRPRREDAACPLYPPGLPLAPEELARLETGPSPAAGGQPYLCTGYWVLLVREPCAMCAMGLVHSRVARVFYGVAEPRAGVLGSRALLHALPGLNHHYEVWRGGLLEPECRRA